MTNTEKLNSCVYAVAATSTEMFYLWKEYQEIDKTMWVEDNVGFLELAGVIAGTAKPVNIELMFADLYGHKVMFYTSSGRYSDRYLIQEYIGEFNIPTTDAMNFNHAVNFCRDLRDNPTNKYVNKFSSFIKQ